MKVLAFSAYYTPEIAASMYLTEDIYKGIVDAGHTLEVFVPMPTRGISKEVREKYKHKKNVKKYGGKMILHRISMFGENKNTLMRALRYLLINAAFIWKGLWTKADVIFVQSTPPTQGMMAAIVGMIKRIPVVYNLQDIFPDSLVGAGMTTENSIIYKIGRRIEDYTYRNADRIIVISNDIKKNIIKKGVPAEKIVVIPNWVDSEVVHPISKENNYLYEKYRIAKDKFTIVYAGNLGYAQNIEVIIKAAEMLQNNKAIQFVMFGKGAQEEEYIQRAMGLSNISFFPIQPYSEVSYVYSLGNASIVTCKKGFGGSAMPSKTWSIMATGTPVLASFDSGTDLEKLILKVQVGLFSPADDVGGLVNNILELFKKRNLCDKMRLNARRYVRTNLSRERCTQMYIDVIRQVVAERKGTK